jgi:hypothetical protein
VKGVPEGNSLDIAMTRLLLEPFGVDVSHWSLVHGRDAAYNSFSFSDQFPLLQNQPIFQEIKDEAGSCDNLEKKAIASLKAVKPQTSEVIVSEFQGEFEGLCSQIKGLQEVSVGDTEMLKSIWLPMVNSMESNMKKDLEKCLTCHGDSGTMTFSGLSEFVNDKSNSGDKAQKFISFLNSSSLSYGVKYSELIPYKLGVHESNPYGLNMPPTDWSDNEKYAAEYGIDPLNVQNIRRKNLGLFITMYASIYGDAEQMMRLCDTINNDQKVKDSGPILDTSERGRVKAE